MACVHRGTPDEDVLQVAHNEARILVSCDKGFGVLVHRDGKSHAGVVSTHPGATSGRGTHAERLNDGRLNHDDHPIDTGSEGKIGAAGSSLRLQQVISGGRRHRDLRLVVG